MNVELETLHHQLEQALKRLAEIRGARQMRPTLPAALTWGEYPQDTMIPAEGRTRFPTISFDTIFDPATENLTDELSLPPEATS